MKTIGTSISDLLNCHQTPTFNPLNLVVSVRAAMFITITVYSAPHSQCSCHPQTVHPFHNILITNKIRYNIYGVFYLQL